VPACKHNTEPGPRPPNNDPNDCDAEPATTGPEDSGNPTGNDPPKPEAPPELPPELVPACGVAVTVFEVLDVVPSRVNATT
jgi:hypothetical protein